MNASVYLGKRLVLSGFEDLRAEVSRFGMESGEAGNLLQS